MEEDDDSGENLSDQEELLEEPEDEKGDSEAPDPDLDEEEILDLGSPADRADRRDQDGDGVTRPTRQWRGGRNGPRSASSADDAGNVTPSPTPPLKSPTRSRRVRTLHHRLPLRHPTRGNLPNALPFDGDRRKDPKRFRQWLAKVDSYIAIAEKIIGQDEFG